MKKISIIMLLVLASAFPMVTMAQDLRVKSFERNYTSLIAAMHQVKDNNGDYCAVIRCIVKSNDYIIEPNLGVLKDSICNGEIMMWIPQGTKRITIRRTGYKPLVGYEIPVRIESKVDYNVDIETIVPKKHNVYIGAGYHILPISGPSLAVGALFNHHNVELGAMYVINKSADYYFYNSKGDVTAAFNYNAIRAQVKYGYEIPVSDFFSITPQAGVVLNVFLGNEVNNIKNTMYKSAFSVSALGAVRLSLSLSNTVKLHLTPELDAAFYEEEACKLICAQESSFKNWQSGFNLNAGIIIFF